MSVLTTKTFWADAAERAVKTFAQTVVAVLTASNVIGLLDVDAISLLSIGGLAALISILTSIASIGGGSNSASLVVKTEELK